MSVIVTRRSSTARFAGALISSIRTECLLLKKKLLGLLSGSGALTDRSSARYRALALTTASSVMSKAIVIATALAIVPLTLKYLGPDRYGLWMTISAMVLFLTSADLGLGSGLTIVIAEASCTTNDLLAKRYISSAFFALLTVSIICISLFFGVYPHIPWHLLYKTTTKLASSEAGGATAALIACTAVSLPLMTVSRVQLGYQRGYINDLWTAAGNLIALIALVIVVHAGLGLPWLVWAVAGGPVVGMVINWLIQFSYKTPAIRPNVAFVEWNATIRLMRLGALFFIQQCFGLIYYLSDNLVISHMIGTTQVAYFSVVQRIFSVTVLAQYIMLPLGPAIREATVRHDLAWAGRLLRRALRLNLIAGGIGSLILLIASRWIIKIWAGFEVAGIDALRFGFVIWVVLAGYIAIMNAFLNQPGSMGQHLFLFGLGTILALFLKILFITRWGVAGAVWGTIVGYSLVYVVPAYRLAAGTIADCARTEL